MYNGWTFLLHGTLNVSCNALTEILPEEQKKEELEKLYSAIGYSEGEVITAFPKEVHVDCYLLEDNAVATLESCKETFFKLKSGLFHAGEIHFTSYLFQIDCIYVYHCIFRIFFS